MTEEHVFVVAHVEAKDGMEQQVREVLLSFLAPTRQEDGCIRYEMFEDCDHPRQFTFIEEWSSRTALDAHLQTPHITAGFSQLESLVAGEGWIQVLRKAG